MGKFSEFLASSKEEQQKAVPPPPSYGESSTSVRPPTPPPPFPPSFGCIHLARSDRIRLIGLPPVVYDDVEQAILRVWVPGLQGKSPMYQSLEWKLSGYPWTGQGAEAVQARRLLCHVLHALSKHGWYLHMSVDLSKKQYDKDTLFLHSVYPQERYFFSISFNEGDKVRIIDPPSEHVKQAFMTAVRTWSRGIQSEKEKEPGCYQFKLKGLPWYTSDGDQVIHARLLGCTILTAMDSVGFELKGSVDMSTGTSEYANDMDTWFFANKS
ncbi:hypothetical protein D1P53_005809 [Cryptococcus gattii VGV]|nr:hypothetical protein D1P53_005809 [Cryptococcus gattii VGV]